uniref:Uncharacterized protein n=1 Tax=Rhizophora mucronata TaxID=61149 RepID=A0A2P2IHU0_RHIMU
MTIENLNKQTENRRVSNIHQLFRRARENRRDEQRLDRPGLRWEGDRRGAEV